MRRILGIDFGQRRIGLAVADPEVGIAMPVEVYERRSPERDARYFRACVAEQGIGRIVLGLPVRGHGAEGRAAAEARSWGAWLAEVTGLPVSYIDERYSTVEADQRLMEAGLKASQRASKVDMIAAQILLEAFLEAGCPTTDAVPQPLEDEPRDPEESNR